MDELNNNEVMELDNTEDLDLVIEDFGDEEKKAPVGLILGAGAALAVGGVIVAKKIKSGAIGNWWRTRKLNKLTKDAENAGYHLIPVDAAVEMTAEEVVEECEEPPKEEKPVKKAPAKKKK